MGFLMRWLVAFILVALTYNPTSLNYVSWAAATWDTGLPFVVLGGLVLLVAWIVFLNATLRSIGIFGAVLLLALVGALLWVLFSLGWLDLANPSLNLWIGLFAISLVLAVGMYWSILWRRMSGQLDVDETDP